MGRRKNKDVLTTGEVAKICNVSNRTVSKWFDTGALIGYRIPGSKDRRIPVKYLVRFMKAAGMPIKDLMMGSEICVLIMSHDADEADVIRKCLSDFSAYTVEVANNIFTAGIMVEKLKPHVILVDTALPNLDTGVLLKHVAQDESLQLTKVVAVDRHLPPDLKTRLLTQGFAACIKSSCHASEILSLIEELTVGGSV